MRGGKRVGAGRKKNPVPTQYKQIRIKKTTFDKLELVEGSSMDQKVNKLLKESE